MADEMGFAIESIKELLDSPDAKEKLGSILGMLGTGDGDSKKNEEQQSHADLPVESIMKIASAYKSVKSKDDSRINLLRAIKPYMKKDREESIETAIKLLSFAKIVPLLGDMKEVL